MLSRKLTSDLLDKTKIYYKKRKLKDPILIVGLPGIGNVGNLAAEHIRKSILVPIMPSIMRSTALAALASISRKPVSPIRHAEGMLYFYYKNIKGLSVLLVFYGSVVSVMLPTFSEAANERIIADYEDVNPKKRGSQQPCSYYYLEGCKKDAKRISYKERVYGAGCLCPQT